MHNGQEFGEDSLDGLPSKHVSTEMFDPASDYTKKMDSSWLLSSVGSLGNIEKQFNGLNNSLVEGQSVPKMSNYVENWSISPHEGHSRKQFEPQRGDIVTLNSMMKDPFCVLGQGTQNLDRNFGSISCFGHDAKMEDEYGRSFDSCIKVGNPVALGNAILGDKSTYSLGLPHIPCTSTRSFTEVLSSTSHLSRPLLDINVARPVPKTLDLSGFGKHVFQTSQVRSLFLSFNF